MKNEEIDNTVVIKQIIHGSNPENEQIYGLGDDQRVYYWNFKAGQWIKNWAIK